MRPRGARRWHIRSARIRTGSFNPCARAGRDSYPITPKFIYAWFQSMRPRGARPDRRPVQDRAWNRFNPCARAGRDFQACSKCLSPSAFQSMRPRGARPSGLRPCSWAKVVSIHAPARGATVIQFSPTTIGCRRAPCGNRGTVRSVGVDLWLCLLFFSNKMLQFQYARTSLVMYARLRFSQVQQAADCGRFIYSISGPWGS